MDGTLIINPNIHLISSVSRRFSLRIGSGSRRWEGKTGNPGGGSTAPEALQRRRERGIDPVKNGESVGQVRLDEHIMIRCKLIDDICIYIYIHISPYIYIYVIYIHTCTYYIYR